MAGKKRVRESLSNLIQRVDEQTPGAASPDSVPTGFPSVDRVLGGGFRRRDLVVLGGDIGSGKSALALAFALRTAAVGHPVVFFSGEMDEDRLMERALAIRGKSAIDDMRNAQLSEQQRAAMRAATLWIRNLPLVVQPLVGQDFEEALAAAWQHHPALIVVDYIELLPPPATRKSQDEDNAATLRALKAMALERRVACLAVSQLGTFTPNRPDPRPKLEDYGALGAVKQHADVVLSLFREEMYNPGGGVEGATELLIAKNRNGPTGFVDLYFYQRFLRFEDMLDPDT